VNNSNGTVIQDITLDTYGHITGIASLDLDGRYYNRGVSDSRFVNVTGDTMTGDLVVSNNSITVGRPLSDTASADVTNTALTVSSLGVDQEAAQTNVLRLARDGTSGVIYAGLADFDMYRHTDNGVTPNVGLKIRLSTNTSSTYYDALTLESNGNIKTGTNNIFHDSYHPNADKWTTARTLSLTGDASGSTSWDGSGNASISVTVANDSHSHSNYLRSDAEDTGVILNLDGGTNNGSNDATLYVTASSNADWGIKIGANSGKTEYGQIIDMPATFNYAFRVTKNGTEHFNINSTGAKIGGNYIWHAGNDGSGSGLDADLLDGLELHTGRNNVANRVVRTQSNGYCDFGWINTTSGDTSSTLSRIYVDTGDGYIRKSTLAHVASQLPIDAGAPAGSIIYHAASSAPSGYIKANGASLSTSTYATLFAAIGYTYGGSGGSFNVPDLRGEFLRGWDDGRGVDSGRSFGSSQLDQMQRLTGGYNTSAEHFNVGSGSGVFNDYRIGGARNAGLGYGNATRLDFDSANSPSARVSSSTSGETRPRNRALLACIKY
jgi:microcystin-dependent protein